MNSNNFGENKVTYAVDENIKYWENQIKNFLSQNWSNNWFFKNTNLLLFVEKEDEKNDKDKLRRRIIYRVNKIVKKYFENKNFIPFSIVWNTDVTKDGSGTLGEKIDYSGELTETIFPTYTCYFYNERKQVIHTFNIKSWYMLKPKEFWRDSDGLPAEYYERRIKKSLLEINKSIFHFQDKLTGQILFDFVQSKLWSALPYLNIKSKYDNLYLNLKDIDFTFSTYLSNEWYFDVSMKDEVKTQLFKQCYYDGSCGPEERSRKHRFENSENYFKIKFDEVKNDMKNFLNSMFSSSDRVIDVLTVVRTLFEKNIKEHLIYASTIHSPSYDWTLKKVYDEWKKTSNFSPQQIRNFNLWLISQEGSSARFNLFNDLNLISSDQEVESAIELISNVNYHNEFFNKGQDVFDFIKKNLATIAPSLTINSIWDNMYLPLNIIDFQIRLYNNGSWYADIQLNFKNRKCYVKKQCYYDGNCSEKNIDMP